MRTFRSRSTISFLLAALTVAGGAGRARAELTDEQKEVESTLRDFLIAVREAKVEGAGADGHFSRKPEECTAAVEKGTKLGIAPTEVMSGAPDNYLFKRAADKCADYATWHLIVQGAVIVAEAKKTHNILQHLEAGEVGRDAVKKFMEPGQTCLTQLDALIAKGMKTDVAVHIEQEPMTLADAKTKICQGIVDWGVKFDRQNKDAIDAEAARLREKYAKHGIK